MAGVTTAWFDGTGPDQVMTKTPAATMGIVHYVAMLPKYKGQGLSKPLMVAVLKKLRQLGHTV